MRFEGFSFGSIRVDGASYDCDVAIDRGEVRKRKKKASKKFREVFGHTPLLLERSLGKYREPGLSRDCSSTNTNADTARLDHGRR